MPRWNTTLNQKCRSVLDEQLGDLEPALYNKILNHVLTDANPVTVSTKRKIEKYVRTVFDLNANSSKASANYWLKRGWSEIEAKVKARSYAATKEKRISPYSQEFWTRKINPATNKLYTPGEADYKRNSMRPIRKEYWLEKGYTEIDAIQKAAEVKQANNKKGAKTSANRDTALIKAFSHRTLEYWMLRGYSEDDAKQQLKEAQTLFNKEICIEKYGLKEGMRVWQDRQDRWQATLNAKPVEERARINRLKLTKGITVSKREIELLNIIREYVDAEHQFVLSVNNKKQYIYDIRYKNKIIEYNGDFWHANPKIYNESFFNKRMKMHATDIWEKDKAKLDCAIKQGYSVLVVWEHDFKTNKQETINECIRFLTQ